MEGGAREDGFILDAGSYCHFYPCIAAVLRYNLNMEDDYGGWVILNAFNVND